MIYSDPFFFEFSNVNVLKINLTKLFLIYASVNHIRIFQRLFLIYAPINHIQGSCNASLTSDLAFGAHDLTKRIFLIKNRYFIVIETILNVLSLSNYQTVRL